MPQPIALQDSPQAAAQPVLVLNSFADIVALASTRRDVQMKSALESDIRLVRMEDGKLEVSLEPHAPRTLVNDLSRKLEQWTGRRWMVAVSTEQGQPTLTRFRLRSRPMSFVVACRTIPGFAQC